VGFIIANLVHFVHNVFRMGTYYEKYKVRSGVAWARSEASRCRFT
jgi:hypothetical protein